MRTVGFGVVILGLAAFGLVAIDAFRAPVDQTTGPEDMAGLQRLVAWAAFVAAVALATAAGGLGALLTSRRGGRPADPPGASTDDGADRILHLPLGAACRAAPSATLMRSAGLELIRLVIPAGREIPPHRAPGEITVQCIEGRVAFEHDGRAIELQPGDLLHVCPQETHALKGIVDSSVLVTRLRPHADELPETFPAS